MLHPSDLQYLNSLDGDTHYAWESGAVMCKDNACLVGDNVKKHELDHDVDKHERGNANI